MKAYKTVKLLLGLATIALLLVCAGCAAPHMARPDQLTAPQPVMGNTGKYMSPYTSDEVLAEWVDNAIKAQAAGKIGGAIGAYAGTKALEQVPFIGGILGEKVGNKIGKEIAIKCAGGMDFICNSSDLSFNTPDDMAIYLYVKHSSHEHYQDALKASFGIYPEFEQRYYVALANASKGIR
jgi:hypothetical protein